MRVAVLRFPGTWSETDFAHALSLVGADADILWHADADLRGYDAAVVPGGFAYGDYLRAGAIAAISPAADELRRADREGMPILGSCNGFQILCEIGLLPGALVRNRHGEFRCDWVHLRIESDRTPFTGGLRGAVVRMPIAHGEGCYFADDATLDELERDGRVLFRYVREDGARAGVDHDAANPNGSLRAIAGVLNARGNVAGLMPHPERCSEELLGGTDGRRVLEALTASRHTGMVSGSVQ